MSLLRAPSGAPSGDTVTPRSVRSGPAGTATPRSGGAEREVVSASLDGLVHALDGLKSSLGYDDYSTVRSLIEELRSENEELRQYAETAIREAQRLKEAHDQMAERLAQRELEDDVARATAESHRLTNLADDFEREAGEARREEIERLKRETDALRARVVELEEENGALEAAARRHDRVAGGAAPATPSSASAPATAASVMDASPSPGPTSAPLFSNMERVRELEMQNDDLRAEIASLTETMFGKGFKAPSAWAEREIKYKRDEQTWAEERRELEVEVTRLGAELASAKNAEDTDSWRDRIAGLEADLVQRERERAGLAAQVHELRLAQRAAPGEYADGVCVGAASGPSPSQTAARQRRGGAVAEEEHANERLFAALQERDALRNQLAAALAGRAADDGAGVAAVADHAVVDSGAFPDGTAGTTASPATVQRQQLLRDKLLAADRERHEALLSLKLVLPDLEAAGASEETLRPEGAAAAGSEPAASIEAELLDVETTIAAAAAEHDAADGEDEDALIERLADLKDKKERLLGELFRAEPRDAGEGGKANEAAPAMGDDFAAKEAAEARLLASLVARNAVLAELAAGAEREPPEAVLGETPSAASEGDVSPLGPSSSRPLQPPGPSRESSSGFSAGGAALAADRAAADAAWEAYAAGSDLPALRRAKAELEARCSLLESQMGKMAGELQQADEQHAEMEARVIAAVETGDVAALAKAGDAGEEAPSSNGQGPLTGPGGRAHRPGGSRARLTLGRMFRSLGARPGGRDDADGKRGVAAGASDDGEGGEALEAAKSAGAAEAAKSAGAAEAARARSLSSPSELEQELQAARAENSMIMEHLVMTKVRMAEMEGDYLATRRELLRAREKQLELAKRVAALRADPGSPLRPATSPGRPSAVVTPSPAASAAGDAPVSPASPRPESSQVGETGSPSPPRAEAPAKGALASAASPLSSAAKIFRVPGL